MSAWLPAIPVVVVAAGLLFIPGWATALGLGFRGFDAIGLAPAITSCICGAFGIIFGLLGISWSPLTLLAASATSVLIAFGVSRLPALRQGSILRSKPYRRSRLSVAVLFFSVAVAALLAGSRLIRLFGAPTNIAQVFDNVFHLNAIRFIIDSGNASSLTLNSFQGNSGLAALYPATWHTLAATIVQITGSEVQVSENALNLVVGALVWPVSCVFFTRRVISSHPIAVFAAAILSVGGIAFPFLTDVWGPLFPYTLAVSILPVSLALVALLVRACDDQTGKRWKWAIPLVLAIGGMSTAHMSSFNALLAISSPLLIMAWWSYGRSIKKWTLRSRQTWLFVIVSAAMPLLALLSWTKVRPAPYDNWGPTVRSGAAIGEVLTNSTMQQAPAWIMSLLAMAGVIAAFRLKRYRWLVASFAIAAFLYVVDAAWSKGFWRDFITGTWYQDTYRLAALLPVLVTPLAAFGMLSLWRQSVDILAPLTKRNLHLKQLTTSALAVTALLIPFIAAFRGPVAEYVDRSKSVYSLDKNSPILSTDELALIKRLPLIVPEDAKIADNPWNGSSWAYAFTGREVLTPHLFPGPGGDRTLISQRLKFEPNDPAICRALKNEKVEYVLDFGDHYLLNLPATADYPGVVKIDGSPGFQEVDSEGPSAKLYKITSCK